MICVLKTKEGLYIQAALGEIEITPTGFQRKQNTPVKLYTTKYINKARLIEDPDIDAVKKYGLIAVTVKADKPIIEETGYIYDQE